MAQSRSVHFNGGHPMRTIRQILVFPLVILTAAASPAFPQSSGQTAAGATVEVQHLVPPDRLAAVVADRVASQDASRAAIRQALARTEVRDVAASMHLDLARADAVVDTMS